MNNAFLSFFQLIRGLLLVLGITAIFAGNATANESLPSCIRTTIIIDSTLDSAKSKSGDVFTFKTTEPLVINTTPLPSGTTGYGVVANASHAERGGRPGYLALETRFLWLSPTIHIPVIIDRTNDDSSTAMGGTANAPAVLGLIPIVGYAVGGYDAVHHGKDATISQGTKVAVIMGDDALVGMCSLSQKPVSTPKSSMTPSPSPAL
jgi:hypothetical protein